MSTFSLWLVYKCLEFIYLCNQVESQAMIIHKMKKNDTIHNLSTATRSPRWFPFYTIGRFPNDVCEGKNKFLGTCMVRGECIDNNGILAGSCSNITKQAMCCIFQKTCGATTHFNNTYFYNTNYPGVYNGGGLCTLTVEPCDASICQLRIDFLALSLAPPNGDGYCVTDSLQITGGSSRVPTICGENSGQHIYVNFDGQMPITILVATTMSYTFNRQWQLQIAQLACTSQTQAPSGCLQYYREPTGTIQSFNYASTPNSIHNVIGMPGTRQLANQQYGICIRMASNACSITWMQVSSDNYTFTLTNDVGAIDPTLLGTAAVQSQSCITDYIIIPNPQQNGQTLPSDRFCGLGLLPTTTSMKPFVVNVVTDGNEDFDIANRGFYLTYKQNPCPII